MDRLTEPKFIVNAAGDQFFLPDSSRFYYDKLQGEKLIRYIPNADHGLKNSDAVESIAAYYQLISTGKPRPEYTWTFLGMDRSSDQQAIKRDGPSFVMASSQCTARDFRYEDDWSSV